METAKTKETEEPVVISPPVEVDPLKRVLMLLEGFCNPEKRKDVDDDDEDVGTMATGTLTRNIESVDSNFETTEPTTHTVKPTDPPANNEHASREVDSSFQARDAVSSPPSETIPATVERDAILPKDEKKDDGDHYTDELVESDLQADEEHHRSADSPEKRVDESPSIDVAKLSIGFRDTQMEAVASSSPLARVRRGVEIALITFFALGLTVFILRQLGYDLEIDFRRRVDSNGNPPIMLSVSHQGVKESTFSNEQAPPRVVPLEEVAEAAPENIEAGKMEDYVEIEEVDEPDGYIRESFDVDATEEIAQPNTHDEETHGSSVHDASEEPPLAYVASEIPEGVQEVVDQVVIDEIPDRPIVTAEVHVEEIRPILTAEVHVEEIRNDGGIEFAVENEGSEAGDGAPEETNVVYAAEADPIQPMDAAAVNDEL